MTMRISHLFAFLFLFISTASFCQITDTIHLQEVVLNQKTKFKKVKTGKGSGSIFSGDLYGTEFGCCYKSNELKGKLETIKLFFRRSMEKPQRTKNKLILRFYSLGENGLPDKELTTSPLTFTVNNIRENIKLDLSSQNIYVDGYVVVTLEKLTNKGVYDFFIKNNYPKENEGYYLTFENGKWRKSYDEILNHYFKMEFELSNTTQNL